MYIQKIGLRMLPIMILLLCVIVDIYGQTTITGNIMHNGVNRNYRLRLPKDHTIEEKIPLVFNLHGFTSNAVQQELYSGMNAVADVERFAVCYPNGVGNAWNVGWAFGSTADDVGFISLLIDDLVSKYGFNQNKVYACGMSNGGFMSYKLTCELNNKIAAIASVTGSMVPGATTICTPERLVPIMEIHGTDDNTVAYNGTPSVSLGIPEILKFWQNKNECDLDPIIEMIPNTNTSDNTTTEKHTYINCKDNKEVVHYKVIGGGHTWPGAAIAIGPTSQDFNASATIWDFFNRYSLENTSNLSAYNQTQQTAILNNPSSEYLNIHHFYGDGNMQIYDLHGRNIAQSLLNIGENQISIGHLESGIYFTKIGNQPTLKFIKI
jgi:polyhydroxybutyrate depolymerase